MIGRINAFLLCMLGSFTIWGYGRLPARIPIHFDLAGQPNGWGPRSMALFLPLVGFATVVFLYFVTRLAVRNPRLVNMPDKKKFLQLPETEQRWVLEVVTDTSDWIIAGMIILFIVIQLSIFRAAAGLDVGGLLEGTLITLVVAMIVLPIVMLVQLQKRLNEAIRRSHIGGVMR